MKLDLDLLLYVLNSRFQPQDGVIISGAEHNEEAWIFYGVEHQYILSRTSIMELFQRNPVMSREEQYEILARHILNQLFAILGNKLYPEIVSTTGDEI